MSKEEIKAKIQELEVQKNEVKGTPCEVYSRVVGYLHPVQSWNKGKKEEFTMRKNFRCTCQQSTSQALNHFA